MRRTMGLVAGVMLLGLAACGDDDGGETLVGGVAGEVTVTSSPELDDVAGSELSDSEADDAAGQSLDEETIDLGTEIYYESFRVEFGEARVVLEEVDDGFGGGAGSGTGSGETEPVVEAVVEVDATAENLHTEENARFDADEIELEWAGGSVPASADEDADSGSVRPGASSGITLSFPVDDAFSFADATLYAGTPSVIQPVVPLGDPAATESAAPIELQLPAEVSASDGPVEAEITGMVLRSSNLFGWSIEQQPVDEPVLEITLDLTRHDGTGDAAINHNDQRLELPDGTEIAPPGGHGFIEVLAGGSTTTDAVVVFELSDLPFDPDELTGKEFTLVVDIGSAGVGTDPHPRIPIELRPAE